MFFRLRQYFSRPVVMGWVLVTYLGIIAALFYTTVVDGNAREAVERESRARDVAIRHEAVTRADDLCEVLGDVHTNAHDTLRSERRDLARTRDYLDSAASHETPALRLAIVGSLQDKRDGVRNALDAVRATIPPQSCGAHLHRHILEDR